ncbi:28020_t:CDS:1, partial [Gigaspora margarita]
LLESLLNLQALIKKTNKKFDQEMKQNRAYKNSFNKALLIL